MKLLKNGLYILLMLLAGLLIFIWWANHHIEQSTEKYVFDRTAELPNIKTGLLLGTSQFLENGHPNPYFTYRINAAEELYKSGKIKYLIVSGDNSVSHYNEPEDMQNALIERGIPKDHIFMDYAGFRTLDSVVRAKDIFKQNKIIVISQKFHTQRAVFLAQKNGIDAYGFNARDVNATAGLKTNLREKFARAKVFVDLLIGVEPKYLGKPVSIP